MLHKTIKDGIKEAMRAKDTVRLETLRQADAQFQNEMMASNITTEFIPDEKAMAIVRRLVKQHKDSIDQFEKGGRKDLVASEQAELEILQSFLPAMMSRDDIRKQLTSKIAAIRKAGEIDPKSIGKIVGSAMKELAGKADGADVKAVVEELLKS